MPGPLGGLDWHWDVWDTILTLVVLAVWSAIAAAWVIWMWRVCYKYSDHYLETLSPADREEALKAKNSRVMKILSKLQ